MVDDEMLKVLAIEVSHQLISSKRTLASAESCTGGWFAKLMTDIAGSSEWFDRGFITYSNESKQEMLGVSSAILVHEGAVSESVVTAMVRGALTNSQANISIAVSGIAGPGGGSKNKPVGTVWLAWKGANGPVITQLCQFAGDRDEVRRQSVARLLKGICEYLSDYD